VNEKHDVYERAVEHSVRVRYSETDKMGIVYHANYIVWFEIGRTEFCRAAGFPYSEMEREGILILVTGVDCRYRRSASYDDEVTIRTRMGDTGSRGLSFFYEIVRSDDGALLAEGSTRHIFVDGNGKPIRIPEAIHGAFSSFVGASSEVGPAS
jgi:acyl-CoA thioester hydrolase